MNAKAGATVIGTSGTQEVPEEFYQNEVTLGRQVQLIWKRRWLVAGVVVLSAVVSTAASYLVTPKYEASVLLMPVSQDSGGLNSLISKLGGGLADLAGLASSTRGKEAEEVAFLKSRALVHDYIEQNNLLPVLFPDRWDARTKTWKPGMLGSEPTIWKAVKYFSSSILRVSTNTDGLVTLYITWKDSTQAARWANGLVMMTNDHFRDDAVEEHERNISFLTAAAVQATAVEVKEGIYSLLTQEVKNEMLARGTTQFAFKVVDPAVIPEEHSSPKRIIWLLVGAMLGFAITAGVIIMKADRSLRG
jgi:uncharacterized protein involved in exopolysaccharide biosynthesis